MLYPLKLTSAELATLEELVKSRQEEGSYFGPREQYYNRLVRIIAKIEAAWYTKAS